MSRKAGFTLIEVLVSIVLTAVVSLLVYGAVRAAHDVQTRITAERRGLQTALAMRLLLEGALAGAQIAYLAPDTMFLLSHSRSPQGVPRDRLTFVSSGDFPPLSSGADWVVTVQPTRQGLQLIGGPIGIRTSSRLLATLPGVTGLGIRVRHHNLGPGWSEEWASRGVLPEAVQMTYWTDAGPIGEPLVVSLPMGTGH